MVAEELPSRLQIIDENDRHLAQGRDPTAVDVGVAQMRRGQLSARPEDHVKAAGQGGVLVHPTIERLAHTLHIIEGSLPYHLVSTKP